MFTLTEDKEHSNNKNFCLCGCGQVTNIYRGKPREFIYGHNMRNQRNIRKGYTIRYGIYKKILRPHHKDADRDGYVYEHRYRMELKLGRYLKKGETVHHIVRTLIDGLLNNDEDNLMLFSSHSEHIQYERKIKYWNRYYTLPI